MMIRLLILLAILLTAAVAESRFAAVAQQAGKLTDTPEATLQELGAAKPSPADQDAIDEAQQPLDVEQQVSRAAKNRRYNRGGRDLTTLAEAGLSVSEIGCGTVQPLLPTAYTPVILIGTVTGAQPYLSEDRSFVYSEYMVQVEAFLKHEGAALPMAGDRLIVDRTGGVLRLRNGQIIRYHSSGTGMARPLQVNERYVLFLNRIHDGADLMLGTGFQLRDGKAYRLGQQAGQELLVGSIPGIDSELSDEEKFIRAVRRAIDNPPSPEFYSEVKMNRQEKQN
jgi:hypothetical protein